MNWIKVCLLSSLVVVSGCASNGKSRSPIPLDGPKMVDIYRSASADDKTGPSPIDQRFETQCGRFSTPLKRRRCDRAETQERLFADHSNSGRDTLPAPRAAKTAKSAKAANTAATAKAVPVALKPDYQESNNDPMPTADVAAATPAALHADYVRSSVNEVEVLFPRLPNPDIGIFIYPHLATKNDVPVPGYATVIPLYERVQYAMPGESREAP